MPGEHDHELVQVGTPEYGEWLRAWVAERRPRFLSDPVLVERARRVGPAVAAEVAMRDAAEELERRAEELSEGMEPDVRALAELDPTFRSFCPPLTEEQADELASVYGEGLPDDDGDEGAGGEY